MPILYVSSSIRHRFLDIICGGESFDADELLSSILQVIQDITNPSFRYEESLFYEPFCAPNLGNFSKKHLFSERKEKHDARVALNTL